MNILKELRTEKGLMQREVAKGVSLAINTYNNYELGIRQIPDEIKIKLAEFYDVSLDYLITGKERDFQNREPIKSQAEQLFNQLSAEDQAYILGLMKGMLHNR